MRLFLKLVTACTLTLSACAGPKVDIRPTKAGTGGCKDYFNGESGSLGLCFRSATAKWRVVSTSR